MDGLRMYSYIYGGNTNVNGGNIYVNLGKASKMQHNASPWRINYVGLSHTHHHPVRACNTLLITIFIILVVIAISIVITFTIMIPFLLFTVSTTSVVTALSTMIFCLQCPSYHRPILS